MLEIIGLQSDDFQQIDVFYESSIINFDGEDVYCVEASEDFDENGYPRVAVYGVYDDFEWLNNIELGDDFDDTEVLLGARDNLKYYQLAISREGGLKLCIHYTERRVITGVISNSVSCQLLMPPLAGHFFCPSRSPNPTPLANTQELLDAEGNAAHGIARSLLIA